MINLDQCQEEIDLDEITSCDGFDELKEDVQQAQEDNQDINTDNHIITHSEEIAYNIVNPPTPDPTPDPEPTPEPTPTYTVTFDSQDGTLVDSQTVDHGSLATVPTEPTKEGYTFGGWYKEAGCNNPWDFASDTVTANVTLYAKWTINSYTLVMSKTGSGTGTTTPTLGNHIYDYGIEITISASPATSSTFNGWSGDATGTSNVTLTMSGNKSVTATFTLKSYTITASAEANGSISPSGAVGVNHGADQTFTITAYANYHIADVLVDGDSVGAVGTYTFTSVTADHTIAATFAIDTYTVTYDGNGSTDGTVPIDGSSPYDYGANVTVLGNTGILVKTGYDFDGWNTAAGGDGTPRAANDTFDIGAADVILFAQWTPLYALRETGPAGGLIFYVKEGGYSDGWMYLEAAPADTQLENKEWGSYLTLIGGTGTGIGTGQGNTTLIVDWLDDPDHTETDRAAQVCVALVYGSYSDWFLPSRDELDLMYENLKVFGVGGFADYEYWSSSEHSADRAWLQRFINGLQGYYNKYDNLRGRAVRAF